MAKKNKGNDNEKQGGGMKNEETDGTVMVVLKIDMHCEGCARKVVKSVCSLDGVESVKRGENELKKITVVGKVDPVELCENVEGKIKKKVELISPATKKQNGGGGEQKKQQKPQTAAEKDEKKPKTLPMTTTVLKVSLHCQGCIDRIQKLVRKTKGVTEMSIDKSNDLVTVKGGMDMNVLTATLRDKLRRKVEIVQVGGGSGDGGVKKGKGGGGDGEGKESGGGNRRGEAYKMEYFVGHGQYMYPQYVNGPEYTFNYMHATQMFNDENPNACVIM